MATENDLAITNKRLDDITKELIDTKRQLDYERAQKAEYCRLRTIFLGKNAEAHKALANLNEFADDMQRRHEDWARWEAHQHEAKSMIGIGRNVVANGASVGGEIVMGNQGVRTGGHGGLSSFTQLTGL
jgi:hypothetical protein